MVKLSICLYLLLLASLYSADKVPVLIWTNDGSVAFPQQLVGHSVSHSEFRKSFVEDLTSKRPNNIVLFMQDKLSITDFTRFSNIYDSDEDSDSFKHVKSLMSEMTSTFLPRVALPTSALLEAKHLKPQRRIHVVDNARNLSLDADDGPEFLVVKLPGSLHLHKSFGQLDEIIGMVTEQLKAMSRPFVAFYTGGAVAHQRSLSRQSRRLMADGSGSSGVFVNVSDSVYLYTDGISIGMNSNSSVTAGHQIHEESGCGYNDSSTCVVTLLFDSILSSAMALHEPNLTFEFSRTTGISSGFWYLSQLVLNYKNKSTDTVNTVQYSSKFVDQTPLGYSYHCQKLPDIAIKNATGVEIENAPMIYFDNFQVQAFEIRNGRFGHYNDCIGFFTIGIWMFLISTAILLAVLFFGIIMLLNVSTMDRFDDAKGKTITVAATD